MEDACLCRSVTCANNHNERKFLRLHEGIALETIA
jgi:hypothetical protein